MKKTVVLLLVFLAVICVAVSCDSEMVETTLYARNGFCIYDNDKEPILGSISYYGSSFHNIKGLLRQWRGYSIGTSVETAVNLKECQFSLNADGTSPIGLDYELHGAVTIYAGV